MHKLRHDELLLQRLTIEAAQTAQRHPITLLLSNVRSLYNVGSIFRSCDAALAEELIMCGFTPHPPRKEIYKTALGAVDTVPHRYVRDELDAIREQRTKGHRIIAVELTMQARAYDDLNPSDFPCTLILGNELVGIDDRVLEHCDDSIVIPMYGVKHSLNVSVAAGIVLFQSLLRYRSSLDENRSC